MTLRPDMHAWFRSRIDHHVNGMMAGPVGNVDLDVKQIKGDVTSEFIVVTMQDGTTWKWSGGRYSSRKIKGCYAPLMPRPVN